MAELPKEDWREEFSRQNAELQLDKNKSATQPAEVKLIFLQAKGNAETIKAAIEAVFYQMGDDEEEATATGEGV